MKVARNFDVNNNMAAKNFKSRSIQKPESNRKTTIFTFRGKFISIDDSYAKSDLVAKDRFFSTLMRTLNDQQRQYAIDNPPKQGVASRNSPFNVRLVARNKNVGSSTTRSGPAIALKITGAVRSAILDTSRHFERSVIHSSVMMAETTATGYNERETLLETSPLKDTSTPAKTYDAAKKSIIHCIHGRRPSVCCKDGSLSDLTPPPSPPEEELDHCHGEGKSVGIDRVARRKLVTASILCLLFMVAEIIGGLLANSLAIATDAAHLLTDFASFMISLFSLWLATRPATKALSFGWYRAEVIGALTSVLLIWLVTGILVYMAVERILEPDYEINATIMLISAGLGVVVNIIMGVSLHSGGLPHGHSHGGGGHGHGHDVEAHGHSHDENERANKNLNVRAALIHVIGDFLQSLGVFVAALIIFFRPDLRIFDPICTFIFSVLVLVSTIAILKEAIVVLMEGKPKGIDFREVQSILFDVPSVLQVHNLRIWALSMDKIALSAHIVVASKEESIPVLKLCTRSLRDRFDIFELTLQVEEFCEKMKDCTQCQNQLPNE